MWYNNLTATAWKPSAVLRPALKAKAFPVRTFEVQIAPLRCGWWLRHPHCTNVQ
ncbi:MAG: hypothetical protein RR198_02955 [Oscillospiraceae bacterium]